MQTHSLRDENKSRTRRALREAALNLFANKGYDETTTDEVAEKAGVSPRTFFRYFPNKESVLWLGERDWMKVVIENFLAQPGSLDDWDAIRLALTEAADSISGGRAGLLLFQQASASSLTLRGRVQDHGERDTSDMAEAVAKRQRLEKPDEACILLATVGLVVFRRSLDVWLSGPASGQLKDILDEEFHLFSQVFAIRPH